MGKVQKVNEIPKNTFKAIFNKIVIFFLFWEIKAEWNAMDERLLNSGDVSNKWIKKHKIPNYYFPCLLEGCGIVKSKTGEQKNIPCKLCPIDWESFEYDFGGKKYEPYGGISFGINCTGLTDFYSYLKGAEEKREFAKQMLKLSISKKYDGYIK